MDHVFFSELSPIVISMDCPLASFNKQIFVLHMFSFCYLYFSVSVNVSANSGSEPSYTSITITIYVSCTFLSVHYQLVYSLMLQFHFCFEDFMLVEWLTYDQFGQ